MLPTETTHIDEADITDALDALRYARSGGDQLKIDLAEANLNDMIERYSCHTCHGSQVEKERV
jgi:hypothetical protein